MKDKFFFFVRKCLYNTTSFLNVIIPKYKNKIFIFDDVYRKDNMWAIYNHLLKEEYYKKYKIIYFTNEKNIEIDNNENIQIISDNLIGLYHQLTSKYVFWGYGTNRFTCKTVKKQIRVELWHGSPLKTIGYLSGNKPWYEYKDSYNYFLCASRFFKDVLKKCFEFEEEQGLILGAPRNDFIFNRKEVLSLLSINRGKYSKIILWMPTFRNSPKHNMLDSNIKFPLFNQHNIRDFNIKLNKMNTMILIKPHPLHNDIDFLNNNFSNIKTIFNNDLVEVEVELYELLGQVDALLTDYSSVYFDFLLTQKPIGFILDDISEYEEKRGFAIDNPLDLMPGEKIYTEEDFTRFIENTVNGIDDYKEERKRVNDLVNKYQDNKNCERILNFLDIKR